MSLLKAAIGTSTSNDPLWAYPAQHPIHTIDPLVIRLAVRRLDEALDELESAAQRLAELSWGPGNDGTDPAPVADGMGQDWADRMKTIAGHIDGICEPKRDLGDAWTGYGTPAHLEPA